MGGRSHNTFGQWINKCVDNPPISGTTHDSDGMPLMTEDSPRDRKMCRAQNLCGSVSAPVSHSKKARPPGAKFSTHLADEFEPPEGFCVSSSVGFEISLHRRAIRTGSCHRSDPLADCRGHPRKRSHLMGLFRAYRTLGGKRGLVIWMNKKDGISSVNNPCGYCG